jgi:hypothetical protein
MQLETKTIILYKPASAAWVAEGKTVKQVFKGYANVIPLDAFTTKTEAQTQAAANLAQEAIE